MPAGDQYSIKSTALTASVAVYATSGMLAVCRAHSYHHGYLCTETIFRTPKCNEQAMIDAAASWV